MRTQDTFSEGGMTPLFNPHARPWPAVVSTLALVLFYWGLFRMEIPGRRGTLLDPEESRRLQEDSAVMQHFGKWKQALKPTLQLHASFPDNPTYMDQLGRIYDRLGRYREAAAIWGGLPRPLPHAHRRLPADRPVLRETGPGQGGHRGFPTVPGAPTRQSDSIFYLAHALERNQETDRAAALYREGMTVHPEYYDLTIGLARMQLRQGRARDAWQLAGKVVAQQPGNVDALLVLGLACRQLGDRAGALGYLRHGAELADGYADFHAVLAQIAEEDTDLDGAILHLRKAAALDPGNTAVARRLALLLRANP
jgi:tetratricopeptide (TPR) repeat protein